MRKVIFDPAILKSQQPMAEMMYRLQTQRDSFFSGRGLFGDGTPSQPKGKSQSYELYLDGLLEPPTLQWVDLSEYDGQAGSFIFMAPAPGAGSIRVFVSIRDNMGNVIESSRALLVSRLEEQWCFPAMESIPSGMPITISIIAVDCVGGVRVQNRSMIVP
jgi:hypothetical protein